MQHCYYFSTAI